MILYFASFSVFLPLPPLLLLLLLLLPLLLFIFISFYKCFHATSGAKCRWQACHQHFEPMLPPLLLMLLQLQLQTPRRASCCSSPFPILFRSIGNSQRTAAISLKFTACCMQKKKLLRSINVNSGCPHSVAYRCSRLCSYPCLLLLPLLINSTPTSQAFCLLLLLLPLLRINKYISLTYAQINNRAIF